jgi:hypothetical protein
MEYLGLIIQEGKLSINPIKLSGIKDWPIPTTVKQVRGLLDLQTSTDNSLRSLAN